MMHESPEQTLSASALTRRQTMRGEMIDAFVRLHRRRRFRRRASTALAVAFLLGASAWVTTRLAERPPRPTETAAAPLPLVEILDRPLSGGAVDLEFIRADRPSLVAIVDAAPPLVEMINDGDLVRLLEEMGRPAGLIEVGGVVRLTREVVDPVPPSAPQGDSGALHPAPSPRSAAGEAA